MRVTLVNGLLYNSNKILSVEDLYSKEFLKYINSQSDRFKNSNNHFVNEVFLVMFVKKHAPYEFLFKERNIEAIHIKNYHEQNKYIIDAATMSGVKVHYSNSVIKITEYIISLVIKLINLITFNIYLLLSLLYLIKLSCFSRAKTPELKENKLFSLIISYRGYKKIKKFLSNNDIPCIHFVDPKLIGGNIESDMVSIYQFISNKNIIKKTYAHVKQSYSAYFNSLDLIRCSLGNRSTSKHIGFFSPRIPHFQLNRQAWKSIFERMKSDEFIAGEKESRWGLLANDLALQYKKSAICIPHGIEYAYNCPGGIFGNKVYTTSEAAKQSYEMFYYEKEFIFDYQIMKSIFSISDITSLANANLATNPKIVYFTEGREIERDKEILKKLVNSGIRFYIKLHPNDSISNYNQKVSASLKTISDFNEAIHSNIILARNSTVLLEAVYNNSIAASILVFDEDKFICNNVYPSLGENSIHKLYSISDLINFLKDRT